MRELRRAVLIAVDSVGIDPLGADRPESVYAQSRLLFPKGGGKALTGGPVPGVLWETDVIGGCERGGIECALTYTSIFTGVSAVRRHGLVNGLGLDEGLLVSLVRKTNLFRRFRSPCLANALFPTHLPFFGSSFVQDLLPRKSKREVEERLLFDGRPVRLSGRPKFGFAELFTLAEINQNVFVYAARDAGLKLPAYEDARRGRALTSSMTHELENRFDLSFFGEAPLPLWTPEEAAGVLAALSRNHDFIFYKYQIPDLVSHTGRLDLARETFATIERFVEGVLSRIDPADTTVVVTSDHGHLEQPAYHRGHPKSKVPTWCFGAATGELTTPESIYRFLAAQG